MTQTDKISALQNGSDEPEPDKHLRAGMEAQSYLTRLTRQRLLTSDEEVVLSGRIQTGDRLAKDRLVEANMRLVLSIARSYHNCLIPFEDLVQEGAIGLMTAAERFDPRKGYRFSTYATHWIRQSICRAIDNKSKPIRLPAHVSETLRKIERARAAWVREHGDDPTAEQLAAVLNVSAKKINALLQAGQEPISLDMIVGDEDNTTLAALINDENALDPEGLLLVAEQQKLLDSLLAVLTPREKEIMRRRLGFEEETAHVLQEIGASLSISRERVRQIEMQALRKLKFAAKRSGLHAYISD